MLARVEDDAAPPSGRTVDGEDGVVLLEQTNQLLVNNCSYGWKVDTDSAQGILTILRDQNTERGDFIFYADRLSTMIVEKALTLLPFHSKEVKTPTGVSYEGLAPTESVRSST